MSLRLNFCRSVPPEFLRSFLECISGRCIQNPGIAKKRSGFLKKNLSLVFCGSKCPICHWRIISLPEFWGGLVYPILDAPVCTILPLENIKCIFKKYVSKLKTERHIKRWNCNCFSMADIFVCQLAFGRNVPVLWLLALPQNSWVWWGQRKIYVQVQCNTKGKQCNLAMKKSFSGYIKILDKYWQMRKTNGRTGSFIVPLDQPWTTECGLQQERVGWVQTLFLVLYPFEISLFLKLVQLQIRMQ